MCRQTELGALAARFTIIIEKIGDGFCERIRAAKKLRREPESSTDTPTGIFFFYAHAPSEGEGHVTTLSARFANPSAIEDLPTVAPIFESARPRVNAVREADGAQ